MSYADSVQMQLTHPKATVQKSALEATKGLQWLSPAHVATVGELLQSSDPAVRTAAIEVLDQFGNTEEYLAEIKSLCNDSDADVCRAASHTIPEVAAPKIIEALFTPTPGPG